VYTTRLEQQTCQKNEGEFKTYSSVFTLSRSTRSTSPGTSLGLPLGVSSALGRIMAPNAG
jgi:hypothetical protein